MAESIGDLSVILRGSAEGLAADIKRDMTAAETQIQAKAVALGNLIADGIKAGLAGIGAAIKGAINLGIEGLDRIDALDEAAGKVGLTYNAFQDLKFAAESAGGSVEALSSSLAKMQSGIASGKSEDALELLKLDLKEIKAMEPDKQFAEIIDKLSKLKSTAEKIDITKQIFGKGGIELMNVINGGKQGISEVSALVEKLGGHLREADVAMVGMANDELDKLKAGWGFLKDQIAVGIAPVLLMITEELVKQAEKVGGVSNMVQQWVGGAINFTGSLVTAAQVVDAIGSAFYSTGAVIGAQIALIQTGWTAAVETAKVGLQELVAGFKNLAVAAADAVLNAFNSVKNTALKTLNDLFTELQVLAKKAQGFLEPDMSPTYDMEAKFLKYKQSKFKPQDLIPDLPTGNQPGAIGAELFPKDARVVDYTEQIAALDAYAVAQINANDAIADSGRETANKIKDLTDGKYWGDSFRKEVADRMEANRKLVAEAGDTSQTLLDIDRETVLGKKENLDWFEKESLEHFSRMGKQLYDWQQANEQTMEQFRSLNRDVVGDLVTSWATGTGKISDIVSQWSSNMIRQFVQLSLFGNKASGGTIGGLLGSFAGSTAAASTAAGTASTATSGWASTLGSIFGGFFEKGGRPPMGKISVIGEDGPEFWMPDSAGRIIPNDQLASFVGGGGSGVSVDQPMVFNFHNYYQTGVTQADLAGAMDSMQDAAMAAVYEGVRRGGGYRKGVQG